MDNEKALLWIVAIVAVVGIFAMAVGVKNAPQAPTSGPQNIVGSATASCYESTRYYSTGAQSEPREESWTCCQGSWGWSSFTYDGGFESYHSTKMPSWCKQ